MLDSDLGLCSPDDLRSPSLEGDATLLPSETRTAQYVSEPPPEGVLLPAHQVGGTELSDR